MVVVVELLELLELEELELVELELVLLVELEGLVELGVSSSVLSSPQPANTKSNADNTARYT